MSAELCPCCGQVLPNVHAVIADAARLTPKQRLLFLAVAAGGGQPVSHRRLIDAIYADDVHGGPENARPVMRVIRVYANKKLARFGRKIENVWGQGYRLRTAVDGLPAEAGNRPHEVRS